MKRITRAAAVLGMHRPRGLKRQIWWVVAWTFVLGTTVIPVQLAQAATLTSASVGLSDPRPSQGSVSYTFTGSSVTSAAIRCVKVVFSTTSTGDTAPTGWDGTGGSVTAASSTLVNSSGTGWSLATSDGTSSSGADNIWQYTRTSDVTPSTLTGATFIMAGITNASTADTAYYMKVNTYANQDCATTPRDNASVEFINTNGSQLSLTVDASLSFSVSGISSSTSCDGTTTTGTSTATTIPFGSVTAASNRVVCQDLAAATNATNGYTIYLRYTGKPLSGSDDINDHSGTNASPTTFSAAGTEAYGYSTDDATLGTGTANRFTNGGQKWAAATTSNEEVAYESAGVGTTHYFVGHQVGISLTTAAGIYQTTVIYTCTPVY